MKRVIKYIAKQLKNTDKLLLVLTIFYAVLGIFLILSASSISSKLAFGTPYTYFKKQIFSVAFSLFAALIIICFFPTKTYNVIGKWGGIVVTLVIIGVLINNFGFNSGNEEVTITLLGISIQPAEFIKIMLILFLGCSYYDWSNKETHKKFDFLIPILWCIPPIAFILLGGDKGSSVIIILLISLIFLFVPSKNNKNYTICKALVCFALVVGFLLLKFAYLIIPEDVLDNNYLLSRLNYSKPCDRYTSSSGYQVCNGYIAIDNGGLWGVGIGNSTQKYLYLPASHTDFIFPIVVEELGLIVAIVIILGYILIAYRIFSIATTSYNLRNSLICFGIGCYFLIHIFVNLGGVLGLIPLTGIPLPLLSYGGSSCLAMFSGFAIVQRIAIENKLTKRKNEIKKITGE